MSPQRMRRLSILLPLLSLAVALGVVLYETNREASLNAKMHSVEAEYKSLAGAGKPMPPHKDEPGHVD